MDALHPSRDAGAAGFTDPVHAQIAAMIHRAAGIVLGPEKVSMMNARLNKRVAATGSRDLADYVRRLERGELPDEDDQLISALTTNFTHFFREAHHFEFLREVVFHQPQGIAPIRIWSAGCSTGQEPYSIAITAHLAGARAAITATDIDRAVLQHAAQGSFAGGDLSGLPPGAMQQCFLRHGDEWQIRPQLRESISFAPLNLHGPWGFDRPFDVIFCRNVIIYFDAAAQLRLWERFIHQLRPGGWLFIGHSERIPDHFRDRLRPVRHTVYQYVPG